MKTEIIKIHDSGSAKEVCKKAADALNQGKIIAFPTETVYGLAGRTDIFSAIKRLAEIKQRPVNKPFTIIMGDKADLKKYITNINPLDKALLRRAWPGPLTAVFTINDQQLQKAKKKWPPDVIERLYHQNTIGLRVPDHRVAQQMLNLTDGPVVAPSANLANQPPPQDAQGVLDQLDGMIDLVIDAGPSRFAQASTVVKLTDNQVEILRPGVLDKQAIERMRTLTFLFVCTGNTCRSPMAQGICEQKLAQKLRCPVDQLEQMGYKVVSAGTMAAAGGPATPEAVQACREIGVDIHKHQGRPLSQETINQADYIFAMSCSHLQKLQSMTQSKANCAELLNENADIPDPFGGSIELYRRCRDEIAESIDKKLELIFDIE